MASIFVSYARESETAVQNLAADVESLDHKVWVDHDLKGGREWWDQILAHIRDCHVFMMTLSPESLASAACKREYSYAAELGTRRLLVVADGGTPPSFWRAFVRLMGLLLAIVPLFAGFLPVLFDSKRRALPDYLARTVVLYTDRTELDGVVTGGP